MFIGAHEAETPYKTLIGNAAWLLLHTAPYQADLLSGDALLRFARNYATFAESLVTIYPCEECRTHAIANEELQQALVHLHAYALGLNASSPSAVADALAIHACRMHNAVSMHGVAVGDARVQAEMMQGFIRRMDCGSLEPAYVARVLRARWKS